MKISWRTEWPHWLLLAAMLALAAWSWPSAPDRIPVHWGLSGQVDRYGGKFEGLLAIPLLSVGLYALFLFLPRLDPGRANYASFAHAYATLRLGVLVAMAAIYGLVHLWIRGRHADISVWVPLIVGALFMVVGNLLGKVRPNWFVGVRTPWTLSSKVAWARTNRAGGWLFILLGALLMASPLVQRPWLIFVILGLGAIGVIALAVYSYVLWRGDPDKTPPAGTLPAGG